MLLRPFTITGVLSATVILFTEPHFFIGWQITEDLQILSYNKTAYHGYPLNKNFLLPESLNHYWPMRKICISLNTLATVLLKFSNIEYVVYTNGLEERILRQGDV